MTEPPEHPRAATVRYLAFFLVAATLAGVLDLTSKYWIFGNLGAEIRDDGFVYGPAGSQPDGREPVVDVIDGYFQIRLRLNRGAVWGILSDRPELLLLLSILAIAFIVYMLLKARERTAPLPVSLGLICGGAVGNLWDRHFHAGVRDFLHVFWQDAYGKAWPTFNLADAFIVIGVGLYIFLEIFAGRPDEEKAKAKQAA